MGGTLAIAGFVDGSANLVQNGESVVLLSDGILQIASLVIDGGSLQGIGQVRGNVQNNGGSVAPGSSPGLLRISGDFSQSDTGTLAMELAGTGDGSFDQLQVGGAASLDGTLVIDPIEPYDGTARVGDEFVLIAADGPVSGDFATVTTDPDYAYDTTVASNRFSHQHHSGTRTIASC